MTSATILSFFRIKTQLGDWTQEELSEFYRVESALLQGNMPVITDRGISDEGDPWFVFCREDSGEIIAHFARIDHQYVIVSSAFSGTARGRDFRALIGELMSAHPLMLPRNMERGQNVLIHPAALLVALVATSFIISSEREAQDHKAGESKDAVRPFSLGDFAILSAIVVAATCIEKQLDSGFRFLQADHENGLLQDHGSSSDVIMHSTAANDHGRLDTAFDNAIQKFITDISAIDLNLAQTSPNQDVAQLQTHLPPLVGQSTGVASSSTTSETAKYYDITELNAADATQVVRAQASELNFYAGPSPISSLAKIYQSTPMTSGQSLDTASGPGSIISVSTEAYKTLNSELGASGSNVPVLITAQNLPVDGAIQQAMSHVGYQTGVSHANTEQAVSSVETNSTATDPVALVSGLAEHPSFIFAALPANGPAFANDPQASAVLSAFIQQTPRFQVDVVGNNLVVVDTNTKDIWNSDFGMQTWKMGDGSTLTIVGIIPHAVHAWAGAGVAATA